MRYCVRGTVVSYDAVDSSRSGAGGWGERGAVERPFKDERVVTA